MDGPTRLSCGPAKRGETQEDARTKKALAAQTRRIDKKAQFNARLREHAEQILAKHAALAALEGELDADGFPVMSKAEAVSILAELDEAERRAGREAEAARKDAAQGNVSTAAAVKALFAEKPAARDVKRASGEVVSAGGERGLADSRGAAKKSKVDERTDRTAAPCAKLAQSHILTWTRAKGASQDVVSSGGERGLADSRAAEKSKVDFETTDRTAASSAERAQSSLPRPGDSAVEARSVKRASGDLVTASDDRSCADSQGAAKASNVNFDRMGTAASSAELAQPQNLTLPGNDAAIDACLESADEKAESRLWRARDVCRAMLRRATSASHETILLCLQDAAADCDAVRADLAAARRSAGREQSSADAQELLIRAKTAQVNLEVWTKAADSVMQRSAEP